MRSWIPNIILGSLLGSLTAMGAIATAAEPDAAPSVESAAPVAAQPDPVTVDLAPGVELPPEVAAQVRAAIADALAGRPAPGAPIEVTLEADGALVRVGSLSRRIAIPRWDYSALRTVALHVLDLLQPAPDVPEVLPANSTPEPGAPAPLAAEVRTTEGAPEHADEPGGPWSLLGSVAGARGVQSPDPWMVSLAVGVAWTHDWLRLGLEAGWDHAVVRHPDGMTTVNYDATPLRLVFAAQNKVVMGGFRAGLAEYRVTSLDQPYWELTPLIGPFLAARFPIAGRFRGLLVGGFDYFARRTQLSTGVFDTAYSTPQVAPYVGVVVEGS